MRSLCVRTAVCLALVSACGTSPGEDSSSVTTGSAGTGEAGTGEAGSESAGSTVTSMSEGSTSESGESGAESETGIDWTDVPCIEREVPGACAHPLGAGGDYDDYCAWTMMNTVLDPSAPACNIGDESGICLTYGQALDGCAGSQPSGCLDGYSGAGVLDQGSNPTLIMDLTDICMVPREVENCVADDPSQPAACGCACGFLGDPVGP